MTAYDALKTQLTATPKTWLITGVAGFIGSHLLETLLKLNQRVVGLDNFATGFQHNLDQIRKTVDGAQWAQFKFIRGDICSMEDCNSAFTAFSNSVDYVLHQAALGSIPRSLADPLATHATNITGFTNMLVAAQAHHAQRFVFASSSSVYGDHPALPKCEDATGKPLSPYALSKSVNEQYAEVFARCYDLPFVGLRYFNVFGPRQNPDGAYAAVIPKWINAMIQNQAVHVNGDGSTSRDFCYVANAVQANLLAATSTQSAACNQIYNIAVGERTDLNQLHQLLLGSIRSVLPDLKLIAPIYQNERKGDVKHSLANISKAKQSLGYNPAIPVKAGLEITCESYLKSALYP
jgi:UDP-N-acetylglucosamine/UDP-N-acetylgalactosamine 4-epimerase